MKNIRSQNTVMESKPGRGREYAKRAALSARSKSILAAAVLIGLVSTPLLTNAQETNEKRTLTGNWIVAVTRLNPPPGQAPNILNLSTYFEDGNVVTNSSNRGLIGTGHGHWERTGRQQFTRFARLFLFDAAGNYAGIRQISATLTLSEDGTEFHATGSIENFDTSGNPTPGFQSTEVGRRY
jgi:hypothetical protein